mmetsp:Transcript_42276/g.78738  ORF Transcript_42276/g.78738 Transcript_42276/m.78738 type:complete len:517 (-) Transcript_42276:129-1679(-)
MASFMRGNVLDQSYDFEYEVGQWTYGQISVVRHRESDKLRACKIVPKSLVRGTPQKFAQLRRLADLQHPYICSVTEVLEDQGNYYIVSEFMQGGEVSDWVERLLEGYVVQEQTCAAYIRQAIIAMVHSHSAQVYHGSLLPSSLSLSSKMPDATVKVTDFGIAPILDPDNAIIQRNNSPYTAPEILSGEYAFVDSSADMYSIGAIAHALLVGKPPSPESNKSFWAFMRGRNDDALWAERSALSRDFVQHLLRPWDERLTPARALQHPWLKGLQPIGGVIEDTNISRDIRHKTLCYMLAVLMVPSMIPYKDFENMRSMYAQVDADKDGLAPRHMVKRILMTRCNIKEAVDAAIAIADVNQSDVLDLCSCACADLIAREFFAAGPTGQPLLGPFRATDLAPRMLKRFFEAFGAKPTVTLAGLRARIRTSTANEFETHAHVSYDQILEDFPDSGTIDAQMLTTLLSTGAGKGTPLGDNDFEDGKGASKWSLAGLKGGFMGMFQACVASPVDHEDISYTGQ